jgi:hypothetical protein
LSQKSIFPADILQRTSRITAKVSLSDRPSGSMWQGESIALVDLALWHELVDVDGPRALNLNGLELLVLDNEIPPLTDLIPSCRILPWDHRASLGIHILLLEPVSVFRLMRLN